MPFMHVTPIGYWYSLECTKTWFKRINNMYNTKIKVTLLKLKYSYSGMLQMDAYVHTNLAYTHIYPSWCIPHCAGMHRHKSICTLGEGTTKSDSNQILFMQSAAVPPSVISDTTPEWITPTRTCSHWYYQGFWGNTVSHEQFFMIKSQNRDRGSYSER